MISNLQKYLGSINEILFVVAAVVKFAEAEHGDGTGETKKAQALEAATNALKDELPWIADDWGQKLLGLTVNLLVWLWNKLDDKWRKKAADFFDTAAALLG